MHTFETVYLLCGCIYITIEETFLILIHKKPKEKSNCVFLIAILIAMRLPNNVEMDMLEAKENSKLSFHCYLSTYQSESVHIERRPMPLFLPALSRVFLKRRLTFRQQFLSTYPMQLSIYECRKCLKILRSKLQTRTSSNGRREPPALIQFIIQSLLNQIQSFVVGKSNQLIDQYSPFS